MRSDEKPVWPVVDTHTRFQNWDPDSVSGVTSQYWITAGKKYDATLRFVYKIILQSQPQLYTELCLRLHAKSLNDRAHPNRLVPTLLLLGSLPYFFKP